MSANNSSVVNALGNNQSAIPTTPSLLSLLPELVDAVAQALDKPADLLSFRAACHELRNGSSMAFCRRFFGNVCAWTSGSSSSFQELTDVLLSTNLPQAQCFATILGIEAPSLDVGWGIDDFEMRKRLAPSLADVKRLLAAMPNLVEVRLAQCRLSHTTTMVKPLPVLLKGLAAPGPHLPRLRGLTLIDAHVKTSILLSVLEAHKHSLDHVFLGEVTLTGGSSDISSWLDIFKAMHSTNVSCIKLFYLQLPDNNGESNCLCFPDEIRTQGEPRDLEEWIGSGFLQSHHAKPALEIVLRAFGVAI